MKAVTKKSRSHRPLPDLAEQVLRAWRVNCRIELALLRAVPAKGFLVRPPNKQARNVAQIFGHTYFVHIGWLGFFDKAAARGLSRFRKGVTPTRAELKRALERSGKAVEDYLARAMRGGARIQSFRRQPVRWFAYLVAHDSHHRGQIARLLKDAGMKLPEPVANGVLWREWYWGKE